MGKTDLFSCGHGTRLVGKAQRPTRDDACDRLITWETSRLGLADESCVRLGYRAMSGTAEWLIGKVVRAGGVDATTEDAARFGYFYGTYRKFYLRFLRGHELHVARVNGFDRWANSRVYEGESPVTMAALDELLDRLKKDTGARPFNVGWARSIVAQCDRSNVPVFVKQMGDNPVLDGARLEFSAHHGADPSEWPADLRRQEFPAAARAIIATGESGPR